MPPYKYNCADASYNNLCCSCNEHLLSDTLLCSFYHVMLITYAATTLCFDWLTLQRFIAQQVVAATSCLATRCRAASCRCNE